MPSLSSVIKAERVRIAGGVYRLPLFNRGESAAERDYAAACVNAGLEEDLLRESREQAREMVSAAERQREEILQDAQNKHAEILCQAEMAALTVKEEAGKSGYDAGFLEGMAAGQREGNRLRGEAENLLRGAREIREQMLSRVEPQVVELAVRIAQKLVGVQLSVQPDTIVAIVRDALQLVREHGEIVVRLHPEDLPLCRERLQELQGELREQCTLNLLGDAAVRPGECRVETGAAIIECMLDERFARLREALKGAAADA